MSKNVEFAVFAFSACFFAGIFLGGILVYGNDTARGFALAAALASSTSQFVGHSASTSVPAWRVSIGLAYAGFILAIIALIVFAS